MMTSKDDSDVLDCTNIGNDDEDQPAVRLRTGIDIRSLLHSNGGVMFEPEIDESLFMPREEQQNYFMNIDAAHKGDSRENDADREFESMWRRARLCEDEDEDGELTYEEKGLKMEKLTDDGGVKKRTIHSGLQSAGSVPDNATVTMHYSLYLEGQDEPYDSTILRNRAERHRLGQGGLLPGIEVAVKSMLKKEEAEFLIEYEYAFGKLGCPPRVPPEAQILAKIELLDFVHEAEAEALLALDAEERAKSKSFSDIERVARKEHEEGNQCVKQENFRDASRRYDFGIKLLEDAVMANEIEEGRQKKLLLKLYLNRSHCLLKLNRPKKACVTLQNALDLDRHNVKALYRMGKAKYLIGNDSAWEDARRYLMRAQKLAPTDSDIGRELAAVDKKIWEKQQDEKALAQKMLPGMKMEKKNPCEEEEVVEEWMRDEIVDQLQDFKKSSNGDGTLTLPRNFGKSEISLIRQLVDTMDLTLEEQTIGAQKHWVVKQSRSFK